MQIRMVWTMILINMNANDRMNMNLKFKYFFSACSQEERNHIGRMVMHLCLIELFEFRCMQTDPNWSNFLYDEESRRLMLIDFGASRFYTRKFMDNYLV